MNRSDIRSNLKTRLIVPLRTVSAYLSNMPHRLGNENSHVKEAELLARLAELESANAAVESARRAALNLMEDAILEKSRAEALAEKLRNEIAERKQAEAELMKARADLEKRVEQRTRELAEINVALVEEIKERTGLEALRVELVQRIVNTQEEERRRISRDLHDQLGQQLTALRLKLSALKDVAAGNEEILEPLARLQDIASGIDKEIGFLSSELKPTMLDDLGLEEALRAYADEWAVHYEIPVDFHSNFKDGPKVRDLVATHLYRIAQEAMNNTVKHADAKHITVLLERTSESVVLVVEDDGKGFDAESTKRSDLSRGLGLLGMRERANLIGGKIEIESAAGQGTAVYVKVPYHLTPDSAVTS